MILRGCTNSKYKGYGMGKRGKRVLFDINIVDPDKHRHRTTVKVLVVVVVLLFFFFRPFPLPPKRYYFFRRYV